MRILIVEDHDDIRDMLVRIFTARGWEVMSAENGREALFIYHRSIHEGKYFDCILLDVMMPRLNGYAVGVNIRNIERFGDVPRAVHVYMTGNAPVVPPEDLLGTDFADDYIVKPVDPHDLMDRVDGLLKRPL